MRVQRCLLAVVASVVVPSALAHADVKVINGSACVNVAGGWANIEYSSGRARLTSEQDVTMICPIIRDVPTTDLVDARVRVTDATDEAGSSSVTCTLTCCTTAGLSCDSDGEAATDGGGDFTCDFDAIDSENNGPCTIRVLLNGTNDRLRWYEYTE